MRKDLIEAYIGYYEDEINHDYQQQQPLNRDGFVSRWVVDKVESHTPKERLHIYLTWNGIFGYTESIYAIATGEV